LFGAFWSALSYSRSASANFSLSTPSSPDLRSDAPPAGASPRRCPRQVTWFHRPVRLCRLTLAPSASCPRASCRRILHRQIIGAFRLRGGRRNVGLRGLRLRRLRRRLRVSPAAFVPAASGGFGAGVVSGGFGAGSGLRRFRHSLRCSVVFVSPLDFSGRRRAVGLHRDEGVHVLHLNDRFLNSFRSFALKLHHRLREVADLPQQRVRLDVQLATSLWIIFFRWLRFASSWSTRITIPWSSLFSSPSSCAPRRWPSCRLELRDLLRVVRPPSSAARRFPPACRALLIEETSAFWVSVICLAQHRKLRVARVATLVSEDLLLQLGRVFSGGPRCPP